MLGLLLLLSSWNLQANSKKYRTGNRSDAIIIPSPVINYVRPNLYNGKGKFAGPADIWNSDKGFLVQSIDFESIHPESYNQNFPTTGLDGLYFDLLITGIEPEELTWEPVTLGGITATVTNVVAEDWWIPYEDRGVVARVKLTGPEARTQRNNPKPSQIAKPRLPQTFELVGRDRDGVEVVKYGFELRQWFVYRDNLNGYPHHSDQLAWCNGLGYRMSRVRDLSNAKCGIYWPFCSNGIDDSSSSGNYYQRRIGGGFFAEWGEPHSYFGGKDFNSPYAVCWTSDKVGTTPFHVSLDGRVSNSSEGLPFNAICTTP
ncbi:MAG: hypothetical protein J6580_09895 [Gilliamella sp.]|uniref:hypothetical protein n=1 Tax=Gilliamella sp. TaxID=1891236 RepID=UPI0025E75F79|nr:hypothetical protein [Gilliamella sp.]MCO6550974.1 hypothetical protein [Gilliamella sp.]